MPAAIVLSSDILAAHAIHPDFRGYHSCPCRDCFEIAIGARHPEGTDPDSDTLPALCWECREAGCSPDGDKSCSVERDPWEGDL